MAIQFIGKWPFITTKNKRITPFDFYNNLFTSLGNSTIQWHKFIEDSKQNYEELLRSYNTLAEISSPLNFWAENSGKVTWKQFKEVGNELEEIRDPNDSLNKLLSNPNIYLGYNEFKSNILINNKLFGNNYINFIGSEVGTGTPTSMFLLPPQNMGIKVSGIDDLKNYEGDFRQLDIDSYMFILNSNQNKFKKIPKEEILHLRTTNPNYTNGSFLFGQSPLVSAQYSINAIYSGYSAKVGLYKNGPKTILSLNPGNSNEYNSLELPNDTDILTEQNRISKYGLEEGQWHSIISKLPLNANRLSYNVGELQINENNIRDFQVICSAIGIDSRLLGDPSSATFANQEQSEKKFYQGTFTANENAFFDDLTKYIRTFKEWNNRILKPDFSAIPQLAEAESDIQEILMPDVEKGLITRSYYLGQRGMSTEDLPQEYNEYYTYNNGLWNPVKNMQDETEEL